MGVCVCVCTFLSGCVYYAFSSLKFHSVSFVVVLFACYFVLHTEKGVQLVDGKVRRI